MDTARKVAESMRLSAIEQGCTDTGVMSAAALTLWHHLNKSVVCQHLSTEFVERGSEALVGVIEQQSRVGSGLVSDFPTHTRDACLDLFALALRSWQMPVKGRVLEIGCAEADWVGHALKADPSLEITGVDWRDRPHDARWTFRRGDINVLEFPDNSFDWVVAVSAIEHIGLGHYEQDPVREDGDTECLRRIQRWLKPGGSVYFDVPYTPEGYVVQGTKQRTYDAAALRDRLFVPGFVNLRQGYVRTDRTREWLVHEPTLNPTGGRGHFYAANWWMKERE